MTVIGVIPARYKSTRFPGKPLAEIMGKPMIYHVFKAASQARLLDQVIVATEDERIGESCDQYDIPWEITEGNHPTGSDRVAEVARRSDAEIFVNIQGDEPMIHPDTIDAAVAPLLEDPNVRLTNLCTRIHTPDELMDSNVIKIVLSPESLGLYLSRQPIPYPRERENVTYYKQVCVYGFRREPLLQFQSRGQTYLERTEGIELLRFLEMGMQVKFVQVDGGTTAVDTPSDLARVNQLMSSRAA